MNNPLQGPKQQEGNEDLHPLLLRSQVRLPGPGVLMGFSRPMNDCNSIPGWNKQATLCSTVLHKETIAIGNAFVKKLLRDTSAPYMGDFKILGFTLTRLGTSSFGLDPQCPSSHGPLPCNH